MKRIVYISFILAGMAVVSCSKEQIRPIADSTGEVPVWKSSKSSTDDSNSTTGGTGTITDPNNDRDENSRKKN
jgi:hypothetical protein